MKIAVSLLVAVLILFLISANFSCQREPASIIIITHEEPVEGIRITHVKIDRPDRSVILLFQHQDLEEPKKMVVAVPREIVTLKIVTIEQLNGVFAYYMRKNGLSHHQTVEIPDNYQISGFHTTIPTPVELAAGFTNIIEYQWRDINDESQQDNMVQFFTASIGYADSPETTADK